MGSAGDMHTEKNATRHQTDNYQQSWYSLAFEVVPGPRSMPLKYTSRFQNLAAKQRGKKALEFTSCSVNGGLAIYKLHCQISKSSSVMLVQFFPQIHYMQIHSRILKSILTLYFFNAKTFFFWTLEVWHGWSAQSSSP